MKDANTKKKNVKKDFQQPCSDKERACVYDNADRGFFCEKKAHKVYDTAIIGAGASGLMAAISAGQAGAAVVLIEGNEKAGKKLYATGNGKCNFTNMKEDGADETVGLFRRLGMLHRADDEGRAYPYSGQAATVVRVLERAVLAAGVTLETGDPVSQISRADGAFCIRKQSGRELRARTLVIATGGRAGLKYGSTGDGYGFAKAFGHTLNPPRPGLVALEAEDPRMKELKGVRVKASVKLEKEGSVIAQEEGELQFTGTGLSGICIFDLSRFMDLPRPSKKKKDKKRAGVYDSPALQPAMSKENAAGYELAEKADPEQEKDEGYIIAADLAPDYEKEELSLFIKHSLQAGETDLAEVLSGILNTKLAAIIAEGIGHPSGGGMDISAAAELAADAVKRFTVRPTATKGWDDAQVTVGGVRLEEIEPGTMESLKEPGLIFCGEVLDYDGPCGGYNLQWAWKTGFAAGLTAAYRAMVIREEQAKKNK